MADLEQLLSVKEVAKILNMAEITIKKYLKEGDLVGIKIGRVWRIAPGDLKAFIEKRRKANT